MAVWHIYAYKRTFGDICAKTDETMSKQQYQQTAFVGINVSCHNFRIKKYTDTVDRSKWIYIIKF